MTFQAARIQGFCLPQDGNGKRVKPGKHGRLGGFGDLPDLDGIGPATGHSIPCTSWMI